MTDEKSHETGTGHGPIPNADVFQQIKAGNLEFVETYFSKYPDQVNLKNLDRDAWDEWAPLHAAAKYGHLPLIRALVGLGAEVYSHPFCTYPPVIIAAWKGHEAIVRYFLDEIPDKAEGTRGIGVAINLAARQGWLEPVRRHVEQDPLAVHQRGWIGDTPLHWPAHNGYKEIVRYLLDHGADPGAHEIGWIGGTPVHWASERHADIVRMLVAAGADPNAQVEKSGSSMLGATPLHWCARQKDDCAECIRTLRELGADPAVTDAFGKTALDWALELGHLRCAEALQADEGV